MPSSALLKAALLGSIAAWLAGVPVRIFLIRGLLTENAQGAKRSLFRWLERLTARLCHSSICVSPSLLKFARAEGILGAGQGLVLANGMSNGIDPNQFDPETVVPAQLPSPGHVGPHTLRPAQVIGFVGRLVRDKGIEEIYEAWRLIRDEFPKSLPLARWTLGGQRQSPIDSQAGLESDTRVLLVGRVTNVAKYYKSMDLFVFPSHREGFPNAPMEAACMGLPVIATRVVGCMDAVVEDETGILIPPRDPRALAQAIRTYLADSELRHRHGLAGRERSLAQLPERKNLGGAVPRWACAYCV